MKYLKIFFTLFLITFSLVKFAQAVDLPPVYRVYSANGNLIVTLDDNRFRVQYGDFQHVVGFGNCGAGGCQYFREYHNYRYLGAKQMSIFVNGNGDGNYGTSNGWGNDYFYILPNGTSHVRNFSSQIGQTIQVRVRIYAFTEINYPQYWSSPSFYGNYYDTIHYVTILPSPPSTPAFSISNYTPGSLLYSAKINLAWSSSGATGYRLYRDNKLIADLGNVTSYTFDNQDDETTYNYTVTAYNAGGETSGSTAIVVPDLYIPAPSNLQITPQNAFNQTEGIFNLTWTDNAPNETGFNIYVDNVLTATLPPNTISWSTTSLNVNIPYTFSIRAVNTSNIESISVNATGVIPPGALYQRLVFNPMKVTGNTGATLNFAVTVYDSRGQIVQDAPVTFSIVSGTGTFESYIADTVISTNAQGIATVNVVLGSNDFILRAGVLNTNFGYAHGSHEQVPFSVYSVNNNNVATINFDNGFGTATGNAANLNVDILHVYGVSLNPITATQISVLPSENGFVEFVATNLGNASDIFTLATANMPVGWTVSLVSGATTSSATTVSTLTIPKHSTTNFWVKVSPPDTELNVSFSVNVLINISNGYSDNGAYTGFDNNSPVFAGVDFITATAPIQTIDSIPPTLTAISPVPGTANVPVEISLYFQVLDNQSGINASSITVTTSAGVAGVITSTDISNDLKEFRVTFDPNVNFPFDSQILVTLNVNDNWAGVGGPNNLTVTYNFFTISGAELIISRNIAAITKPSGAPGAANDLLPGSKILYHAEIGNVGSTIAASVNVRIDMPQHTKFYNVVAGDEDEVDYVVSGVTYDTFALSGGVSTNIQAIIFKMDTLDIGATKNIRYEVTVD